LNNPVHKTSTEKLHYPDQNSTTKPVPPPGKTKAHPPGITNPSLFAYYVVLMLALVIIIRLYKNSFANHEELKHNTVETFLHVHNRGEQNYIIGNTPIPSQQGHGVK
jgi:hypothetical protein